LCAGTKLSQYTGVTHILIKRCGKNPCTKAYCAERKTYEYSEYCFDGHCGLSIAL
jgi:hypothetical protein